MQRPNAYPPASYNNQPQNIPLQQRQAYQPQAYQPRNNNNLQTPVNAHQNVGRQRIPPSSPVSPMGIPPSSPVSPMGLSPSSPISPRGAPPSPRHNNAYPQQNYNIGRQPPMGVSPSSPISPRTNNAHPQQNYNGRQNYQSNNNSSSSSSSNSNYHQNNATSDYQKPRSPQAPYRQDSSSSNVSSSNVQVQIQHSSSSTTPNQGRRRLSVAPSTGTSGTGATEKYNLSPTSSHNLWESDLNTREPDDDLHDPNEVIQGKDRRCTLYSKRGCLNVTALALILFGILGLLGAYPVYNAIKAQEQSKSTT